MKHQTRVPSREGAGAEQDAVRERALRDAEVRRVIRALAPYGVLRRDALARACGARSWRAGQFQSALDAAVSAELLRRLPLGFYARGSSAGRDPQPRRERLG